MKKIINKKVYDTTTAKLMCGEWWNGYSVTDFEYAAEELYLKKTGEFFLHCKSEGRQRIIPLSYEEARQWGEKRLTAEEYEDVFGEIEEDDGWTSVHVYVRNDLADKMEKEKQEKTFSFKHIVNAALECYFNK